MIPRLEIVPETPADREAIRTTHTLAFGQTNEADLVDGLRDAGRATISLVAREADAVVGHICFSPVTVGDPAWPALALGPMAVTPARQRSGIGSALVRAGLKACRERGETVVFVLGHPDFYPRFGFAPAPPLGLPCEFAVPDEVFMVAELEAGSLGGRRGVVRFHPLFQAV